MVSLLLSTSRKEETGAVSLFEGEMRALERAETSVWGKSVRSAISVAISVLDGLGSPPRGIRLTTTE